MSAVSSVGDLGGGQTKESGMKKGAYGCRVVGTLCLVSRLEGCVVSSARQ
jgi:hypothetical protein